MNHDVADGLDEITLHALEKPREARYQNATEFRKDLEQARHGRQISAAALATGAAVGGRRHLRPSRRAYAALDLDRVELAGHRGRADEDGRLPASATRRSTWMRGGKGRAAFVTVLVLAVLALVGWGAVTWFGNQSPTVKMVAVPTIEGMPEDVAARTLTTNGLRGEKSTAADTTLPVVDAVSQDPEGRSAGRGTVDGEVRRLVRARHPDHPRLRRLRQGRRARGAREAGPRHRRVHRGEHSRPGQRTR